MNVEYKEGLPQSGGITYSLNETTTELTLNGVKGKLKINLSAEQQDIPINIDICEDDKQKIKRGSEPPSVKYLAELEIAERRYQFENITTEDGEEIEVLNEIPFDLSQVTLIIWGTEETENA